MYVVKRDGRQEVVLFDKIIRRLKKLSYGLSTEHCDLVLVAQKVYAGIYNGITTGQLDELAAETAAAMTTSHLDYASVSQFCAFLGLPYIQNISVVSIFVMTCLWCSWLLGLSFPTSTKTPKSRFPRRKCL